MQPDEALTPPARPQRPRVLCFGRFYDEVPGGMQRHVEHLFAALAGQVDFVHLVPSRDRHGASFELNGVPVVRTPSLNVDGSLAISPQLAMHARGLHRRHRFDLVHLHFPDPMSHLAAMAVPAGVPRVITWHADVIRHRTLLKIYRPLLRRALLSAKAIIVPTASHVAASPELSALPDPSRISVVPFGFDLARFARPHPLAAQVRERHPGKRILALGRHVYYKGFDVLIDSMREVDADARLIIGGAGPLTEQWRALAGTLGVAGRVHFAGMIDEADLPAYYQACDLFCLPAVSRAEAFGIVQLEAMACGKPVVSTRLNNGVDFVNQHESTGLTVPPSDPGALAQALNRLLASPALRERMGEAGRNRAFTEFSLDAMGARTMAVYARSLSDLNMGAPGRRC